MPHPLIRPAALFLSLLVAAPLAEAAATEFQVTFTPEVRREGVAARVYVMLGPTRGGEGSRDPRFGPNWFRPQPFFAVEAKGWEPGKPLNVGANAEGYPGPPAGLEPGEYLAQAVVRLNPDTHKLGDGEGNAYGPMVKLSVGKATPRAPVMLTVDAIVPPRKFPETDRIKLVVLDSPLLSAFHKRPIKHRAAVILPEGDRSSKRGTVYIIPGFGGDHFMAPMMVSDRRLDFGRDLIRVVLDPDCGAGHHVFADSAFNGPRGKALVEELIPHIEQTFPALPEARARLVNGHSSGGWSSLWLQATYPDTFGGVWSTSPDPVDFRDFHKVDLYSTDVNIFRDASGIRRPIARKGTRAILFYDNFSRMEDVIGDGGQLHSFEAVFSPLGSDARPRPLWDRSSGAVDPETAKSWEAYDIRLLLERHWDRLGPKLKGKLHVITGELDSFYLEGAVRLLKNSLRKLGSDADVEIVPGRDHSTVLDPKLAARIDQEMNKSVGVKQP